MTGVKAKGSLVDMRMVKPKPSCAAAADDDDNGNNSVSCLVSKTLLLVRTVDLNVDSSIHINFIINFFFLLFHQSWLRSSFAMTPTCNV